MRLSGKKLLVAMVAFAASAAFAGTEYYYTPSAIGNISGRVFADPPANGVPPRLLNWTLWGHGTNALSTAVTGWNLGDFTGSVVPAPLGDYQRAAPTTTYGGMSVELHDVTESGVTAPRFGTMMNTFAQPASSSNTITGAILGYAFHPTLDNHRPFSHGPNSKLYFSLMLQIPTVYVVGNARAHLAPSFTMEDTTTGQYFWFAPLAFNKGAGVNDNWPGEGISFDPGTNSAVVGSLYQSGMKYLTKESSSFESTGTPWTGWRWYAFNMSYAQMTTVLADLNSKIASLCSTCSSFSTNPADYKLGMMLVDAEIARPAGAGNNANLGFSGHGIWLYSTY